MDEYQHLFFMCLFLCAYYLYVSFFVYTHFSNALTPEYLNEIQIHVKSHSEMLSNSYDTLFHPYSLMIEIGSTKDVYAHFHRFDVLFVGPRWNHGTHSSIYNENDRLEFQSIPREQLVHGSYYSYAFIENVNKLEREKWFLNKVEYGKAYMSYIISYNVQGAEDEDPFVSHIFVWTFAFEI